MSDTFWVQLFGFLTLAAGLLAKHWSDKRAEGRLQKGIDDGNKLTEAVIPQVSEKVDSVTRKAVADAVEVKKETQAVAQNAIMQQAVTAEKVIQTVKQLTTAVKGEDGTCLTARIKNLEDQHSELARGQSEMKSSLEALRIDIRNALTPTGANI